MYVDLVVVIVLLLIVLFFFRRFSSFVYALVIIDIFLRILSFLGNNIPVPEFEILIEKYFPSSIPSIIGSYTNGILYTIIMWGFVIIYMIFLSYIVQTFIHKRK